MINPHITAAIAVFFMSICLAYSPNPTAQEEQNYVNKIMLMEQEKADLKVKELAEIYDKMSDEERLKGDAEIILTRRKN